MGHYRAEMQTEGFKSVKWFLDGKEVSENIFNDKTVFYSHQVVNVENHYTTKDPSKSNFWLDNWDKLMKKHE